MNSKLAHVIYNYPNYILIGLLIITAIPTILIVKRLHEIEMGI